MNITESDKRIILKTFTQFLQEVNGKGPRNIYIKYIEDQMHVHIHGVVSDFERYLIKNFGQEAIDTFESFYQRDCKNSESKFSEMLTIDYQFEFVELETDFIEDIFIYKMRLVG